MSNVVRRVDSPIVDSRHGGKSDGALQPRIYRNGAIYVESLVVADIQPKLSFSWHIVPKVWAKDFNLLVFRNTKGFCPNQTPDDLNLHGQLIIEATENGNYEDHPAEGTYYFTFCLYRKRLFGYREQYSVLRFAETIPSAKVAIGRINDQIILEEMLQRHELGKIDHVSNVNDAKLRQIHSERRLHDVTTAPDKEKQKPSSRASRVVTETLSDIDALVEACIARQAKIEELNNDPRFQKLSATDRNRVIKMIKKKLDTGEISARNE